MVGPARSLRLDPVSARDDASDGRIQVVVDGAIEMLRSEGPANGAMFFFTGLSWRSDCGFNVATSSLRAIYLENQIQSASVVHAGYTGVIAVS